jgi:hypothetical protein
MMPLAKLWPWTGHAFILFAIGWAIFVRGGLIDKALPEGVAISQGYWGLVVALIAANALILALALYVRAGITSLVPPNTNFEELEDRNLVISWGTVFVFFSPWLSPLYSFRCAMRTASCMNGGRIPR